MDRVRMKLRERQPSVGSWMQIPDASIAEIMGQAGYDWVSVDLEHGSISLHQLPNLFRALMLGGTLPLARIARCHAKDCKQVLDAGAGGVIVPMIESAQQLMEVRDACCWPPAGSRGVGFSRANLFGKYFSNYEEEAQLPMIVAMIENINALENLEEILKVKGLDAILIGPYDLSASMKITAKFEKPEFIKAIDHILKSSISANVACGIHVVKPEPERLIQHIAEGYCFLAYSIDAVFLNEYAKNPI
ncbi:MAG: 2,4-dihydroxyhept-2-ene-1,7-dioic acid aldolase [Gammaproteobacteria bacterium]|nr:2,4-dihydroxyhept-2-ene-1,7-dioic acid aldolase [Gammaproteobacteria bacterium]